MAASPATLGSRLLTEQGAGVGQLTRGRLAGQRPDEYPFGQVVLGRTRVGVQDVPGTAGERRGQRLAVRHVERLECRQLLAPHGHHLLAV